MARVLRSVSLLALSRWRVTCFESESNGAQWESNRPAASVKTTKRLENQKRTEPAFIEPMRCKPVTALPTDENWTFEIKFDGYRCIAVKRGSEVKLFSRSEKVLNKRFPKVVEALASLRGDFVLDGELVAIDSRGPPSFQLLQNKLSRALPIYFYAFDLLNRDGELLISLPIERGRELLGSVLAAPKDPLRLSPQLQAPSGQVLEAVRKLCLECVVGKRIGSIYEPGERSSAWIKHRTDREQEFAIGGYIPGSHGFDALLVGVCENNEFVFVAKVKDGFVPRNRDEISPALQKLKVVHCPFKNLPEKRASRWGEALSAEKMTQCRWVTPKLVCQVAFVEWTSSGHLRHCTFVAMRDDRIEGKNRNEVLGARINLYMAARKWDMAGAIASHLVKVERDLVDRSGLFSSRVRGCIKGGSHSARAQAMQPKATRKDAGPIVPARFHNMKPFPCPGPRTFHAPTLPYSSASSRKPAQSNRSVSAMPDWISPSRYSPLVALDV
jgi:DNA ligase D-like protein (predicted ligase)